MDDSIARLFDLPGRVALATGGGSVIGSAIARTLAASGVSVALVARQQADPDSAVAGRGHDGDRAGGISAK